MSIFSSLADEHGGKFRRFNQGKGLSKNWASMSSGLAAQNGICGGLSIAFLATERMGTKESKLSEKGAETDGALYCYAERLAIFGADNSNGIEGIDNALSKVAMRRCSAVLTSAIPNTVAKNCVKSPSGLSYLALYSGSHATAVAIQNGQYIYFDPNFGFAKFPDSLKFVLFLESFLDAGVYDSSRMGVIWVK
ncbi:YopT-type cysteine protease domain-containing protein [Paucibacter sp. B51]|uniref:YopT-type cysteine protease domain-containing protein n=1 Tax=Paucibacter sp. B51 TaxID=2993315 RepID=UPI0022EC00B9|nr:YopT-type cysteine protease domain-containing protein [Paucibacter sp. B51]